MIDLRCPESLNETLPNYKRNICLDLSIFQYFGRLKMFIFNDLEQEIKYELLLMFIGQGFARSQTYMVLGLT